MHKFTKSQKPKIPGSRKTKPKTPKSRFKINKKRKKKDVKFRDEQMRLTY